MKLALLNISLFALAACGGGSGTPSQSQPVEQSQTEEAIINLTGQQASDADSEVVNIEEAITTEVEQVQTSGTEPNEPVEEEVVAEEAVTILLSGLSLERIAQSDEATTWLLNNPNMTAPSVVSVAGFEVYAADQMVLFTNNVDNFIRDGGVREVAYLAPATTTLNTTDHGHFEVKDFIAAGVTSEGVQRTRQIGVTSSSNPGSVSSIIYYNRGVGFGEAASSGDVFGFFLPSTPTVSNTSLTGVAKINDFEDLLIFTGVAEMFIDLDALTGGILMGSFTADSTQTQAIETVPTSGNAIASFSLDPETGLLTGYSRFNLTGAQADVEGGIHIGSIGSDGKTAVGILTSETMDGYYAVGAQ